MVFNDAQVLYLYYVVQKFEIEQKIWIKSGSKKFKTWTRKYFGTFSNVLSDSNGLLLSSEIEQYCNKKNTLENTCKYT